MATHEVLNQSPPFAGGNAWRSDPLLVQITEHFPAEVRNDLDQLGRFVLTAEAQDTAVEASPRSACICTTRTSRALRERCGVCMRQQPAAAH